MASRRVGVLSGHLCSASSARTVHGSSARQEVGATDGARGVAAAVTSAAVTSGTGDASKRHAGQGNQTPDAFELHFSPEVARALDEQRAMNKPHNVIVALESTIISHGMPYPDNYQTAREVESIIRSCGAVPATICVLNGKIHVGLTDEQLHDLAKNSDKSVQKVSRRDLPYAMAHGLNGATTVASTMMIAKMANIRLFVTGGIGGVHRSFNETMDVSADLIELGRTAVGVVCAGVKSILDVPRTLEVLETQGVGVFGYKTDEFPCFYYDESGIRVRRVDGSLACARVVDGCVRMDGRSGVVIAVGSGGDGRRRDAAYQRETVEIQEAIQRALDEAKANGVGGSAETPFLLKRVAELTGGASLRRNIELIKRNARVGGEIAVALGGFL